MKELTPSEVDIKLRDLVVDNEKVLSEHKEAIKVTASISGRNILIHKMTVEEKIFWIKYIEELINAKKDDRQANE